MCTVAGESHTRWIGRSHRDGGTSDSPFTSRFYSEPVATLLDRLPAGLSLIIDSPVTPAMLSCRFGGTRPVLLLSMLFRKQRGKHLTQDSLDAIVECQGILSLTCLSKTRRSLPCHEHRYAFYQHAARPEGTFLWHLRRRVVEQAIAVRPHRSKPDESGCLLEQCGWLNDTSTTTTRGAARGARYAELACRRMPAPSLLALPHLPPCCSLCGDPVTRAAHKAMACIVIKVRMTPGPGPRYSSLKPPSSWRLVGTRDGRGG